MVRQIARVVPLRTVNERLNEALAAICNVANAVCSPKSRWLSIFNYSSEAIWVQSQAMSAQHPTSNDMEVSAIPIGLRIVAMFLRSLFLGALVAITVRISSPQSETIWTVYETPGDLIRLALGFAVCLWIVVHLFRLPKNPETYRSTAKCRS
jgi:hypothetical protein